MDKDSDMGKVMTNIRITKRNRQRIYDIGSMGRTINDVLDEILTFWEDHH